MDIRSILVHVDLDTANSTSLRYAIDLAQTFEANLIGVAADQPNLAFASVDGAAAIDFYAMERSEIEKQLSKAEEAFRAAVPASIKVAWRSRVTSPVAAIIDAAGAADLIVTGSKASRAFHETEAVNLGEIVLASGRPVLDVGAFVSEVRLEKVMIAWKDTREARRAVVDALPFLRRAKEVSAVTIGEGDRKQELADLEDLVAWLACHDVAARGSVIDNPEGSLDMLERSALALGADLLVSGGYGHSRMREWLFGGMTRNVLAAEKLNRLISS
ncbi:MAG: universal stress protein [Devosia sp.]